ncbi:uncharacterized protein [Arachis hypogaea]|uniref:uncharacterized protein isoform X1 n=1 Tax=Arachis hypogaea TaxID=3818 RepID=UPI003B22054B
MRDRRKTNLSESNYSSFRYSQSHMKPTIYLLVINPIIYWIFVIYIFNRCDLCIGLVFGAGFALANWVLGPKPPTVNVTAPPPPADNVTAAPALQQVDGDPCSFRAITKLLDCINSSKNEKAINKCQVYMDRLVACRKDHLSRSAGPAPAPVHQAPAPAPAQSGDGSMHDDAAAAAPVTTANSMDACKIQSKAFQDCINSYGSDISKCQFYMDRLAECRKNNGAPMSA